MARANFAAALSAVLKHEGGYVNHPQDPGGATNKGVTLTNYRRFVKKGGTVEDLKRITDEQVATVYRRHYWDRVKGDDLPSGIDYAVFDFGVNSGPDRAIKYLQAVLGVAQDGAIGPVTLAAARKADPRSVINRLCDDRMAFLKRLRHWPTFGRGWTSRVSGVRALALQMADASPAKPNQPQKPSPVTERPEPDDSQPKAGVAGIVGALIMAIAAIISKIAGVW